MTSTEPGDESESNRNIVAGVTVPIVLIMVGVLVAVVLIMVFVYRKWQQDKLKALQGILI